MLLNTFTGNMNIKESLLGAIASGRLSHGLLLCAEKGIGVNHFAFLLACDIVGTSDINAVKEGQNPLIQIVEGEGASGLIRVETIRKINENVNFSSISGEKRVVLIKNCENFNQSSANALLKNLEEPKDDITYILTTNSPQSILPTIRSRCSIYTLTQPTELETLQYFEKENADISIVKKLMENYSFNIGKIKNAIDNPDRYAVLQNAVAVYNAAKRGDAYEVSKLCFVYSKDKENFKNFLDDLVDISHKNLSEKNIKIINTVQDYRTLLSKNINLNLAIENFAVELIK